MAASTRWQPLGGSDRSGSTVGTAASANLATRVAASIWSALKSVVGTPEPEGDKPPRPAYFAYPDTDGDLELRVGTSVYFHPMVKFADCAPKVTKGKAMQNYEEFERMAAEVSAAFGGPKQLDSKFLKEVWDASEGPDADAPARVKWAVNHLIAIWQSSEGTGFVASGEGDNKSSHWKLAKRVLVLQSIKGNASRNLVFSSSPPLPDGLSLGVKTGVISGTPSAASQRNSYRITCHTPGGQIHYWLMLVCLDTEGPLNLNLPGAERAYFVGQPMVIVPKVQGNATRWSTKPALPKGLTIDPACGVISGIPEELKPETSWTVIAKSDKGTTSTKLAFEIAEAPPSKLVYHAEIGPRDARKSFCGRSAVQDFPVGRPLCIRPTIEGNPKSFTVSPEFPDGMSLDPATGVISGTPTQQMPARGYTVVAENESGTCKTLLSFEFKVMPTTGFTFPDIDDVYAIGEYVDIKPQVAGGSATFSAVTPLPPGLVMDPESGRITGSPLESADEASYRIRATNEAGSVDSEITFAVCAFLPEELEYPDVVPEYTVGDEVSLEPAIHPGGCVAKYSVTPQLPEGLRLELESGHIRGRLKAPAPQEKYQVTAWNELGKVYAAVKFSCSGRESVLKRRASIQDTMDKKAHHDFAALLEDIVDVAAMPPEPDKEQKPVEWMLWMVHRVWLDDAALTVLSFNGMELPMAYMEPRIAPKLMRALAVNGHLQTLDLARTDLKPGQGQQLAESLRVNRKLRVLNVDGNDLNADVIEAMVAAIGENPDSALTTLVCTSQTSEGTHFGKGVEQALVSTLERNRTLTKVTVPCRDPHYGGLVAEALARNRHLARLRVKAGAMMDKRSTLSRAERLCTALVLEQVPESSLEELLPETDKHLNIGLARAFATDKKRMPTKEQLQLFAKNKGVEMMYSEVAPLARAFRKALFTAVTGSKLVAVDSTQKKYRGVLTSWEEKNDRWTFEVMLEDDPQSTDDTPWDPEQCQMYRFTASYELVIEASVEFAMWLAPEVLATSGAGSPN